MYMYLVNCYNCPERSRGRLIGKMGIMALDKDSYSSTSTVIWDPVRRGKSIHVYRTI